MLYIYLLDAQKLQQTDVFEKSQDSPKSSVQSINLASLCKYKKSAYVKWVCLNGRCKPVKFTKLVLECNNFCRWNAKDFNQRIFKYSISTRYFVKNAIVRQKKDRNIWLSLLWNGISK